MHLIEVFWKKIWTEKSARFRSLLSAVIFPEGLNFSAAFHRKNSELATNIEKGLARTHDIVLLLLCSEE